MPSILTSSDKDKCAALLRNGGTFILKNYNCEAKLPFVCVRKWPHFLVWTLHCVLLTFNWLFKNVETGASQKGWRLRHWRKRHGVPRDTSPTPTPSYLPGSTRSTVHPWPFVSSASLEVPAAGKMVASCCSDSASHLTRISRLYPLASVPFHLICLSCEVTLSYPDPFFKSAQHISIFLILPGTCIALRLPTVVAENDGGMFWFS